MLSGQIFDLASLLANDISSVFQTRVDQFFVFNIDQGTEEGNAGGEKRKTPEWEKLDEVVGHEGSKEGLLESVLG